MNIESFTEKQFDYLIKKNIERLTKNKTISANPKAYLLGGQHGSGKTTLHAVISDIENDNVITIDSDTFKQQHPNYEELADKYGKEVSEHTKDFSKKMTENIIDVLSDKKYNLTIEGTLKATDVPIKTAFNLSNKGYDVDLFVMSVPKVQSYLGTLERYEDMYLREPGTARATPKQIHDNIVKELPGNLSNLYEKGIFNDIRLYNRKGIKISSTKEKPGNDPGKTLEKELNGKINKKDLKNNVDRILDKMEINDHKNTVEFKALEQQSQLISQQDLGLNITKNNIFPKM